MNNLIPIGAGMLLATLYCALVQKLPAAWSLLKIELIVVLGITAHYVTQAYF